MRIIIIPCLFFIHFYSIFLWVDVVSGSGQSLEDQRNLLLRLREGLVFNSSLSVKLVTWDPSFDCCSWKGVSCENGRVTDLDLSGESISDGINDSSSLFELRYLKRLNLASNRLNSTDIPSRIGELVNLTYLNLSAAGFSGQIPIGIAGLRTLVNVDISSEYYWYHKPLKLEDPNLRTLVKNLSGLEELHLDGVDISTGGDDWCKALSSSLQNLRVLSLSDCNLTGPIHSSLANLRLLSDVRLRDNYLTGRFPEQIFQVPTLKAIDLSENDFLQGTLPEFPQNSSLEKLVLTDTNFSGELPYSIGNLKFLSEIDLGSCRFSGLLPSSVSNLTKLVHVDMSYNSFVGPLPSFSYAKSLTELNLSNNRFNGSIVSTIWNGLSQLSTLDLMFNSLGGTIPSSLFGIPSLWKLDLSHNQFDKLTILNASSCLLEFLDLSFNNLGGSFPMSILKFQNLKTLVLTSNNFTGKIEMSMIGQMKNLSILNLSYNSLWIDANGSNASPSFFATFDQLELASCRLRKFPDFLKNQSKLDSLDLSMNQIPGKIPNWIWRIGTFLMYLNLSNNHLTGFEKPVVNITSRLTTLDLHSNKLQGELPLPPSAGYLDFSRNSFGSVIPSNIGSFLSDCDFFSLSSNNFTGVIPESICNATYLLVLDLSNNSLSGTIPECLANFGKKSLEVMNLQMNNLNGSIPDTFLVGCGLKTLELNGNQFTGPVPKSLANCTELELLNLGNNQLSDIFPCSLMDISSLCVLVLRSNYFYGEMGCLGTKENSTRLQIVDLASNNFSGKLHPRSFLTWKAMIANSDETGLTHRRPGVLGESNSYYQDKVIVTIKGREIELVKILTLFTSIDFSNNKFEGSIPGNIGNLTSLFSLNLSHNAFSGGIPTSMEYLSQLESLDLSCNSLTGTIPQGLAALTYLSALNLSFNHLEGHIPTGSQFDNLCENSFLGNKGLVGPQVKRKCKDDTEAVVSLPPSSGDNNTRPNKSEVSWRLISTEVGFTFGLGIVIGSLLFLRKWREWYFERVDQVLVKIHCHQNQKRPNQLRRIN